MDLRHRRKLPRLQLKPNHQPGKHCIMRPGFIVTRNLKHSPRKGSRAQQRGENASTRVETIHNAHSGPGGPLSNILRVICFGRKQLGGRAIVAEET